MCTVIASLFSSQCGRSLGAEHGMQSDQHRGIAHLPDDGTGCTQIYQKTEDLAVKRVCYNFNAECTYI